VAGELIVAGATRPRPGETANGDGWTVQRVGDRVRVALVDGLGHGPAAAEAAARAIGVLEAQPELDPIRALQECHEALRSGRGAALAVVFVDAKAGTLSYAGVGNVEARLRQDDRGERLISYRGIIGSTLPTLRVFERTLISPWLLVLHSDGISSRAELPADALEREPGELAEALLAEWARPSDDATIVVIKR
jgi:serine phosphatase RsbU (regulator of sigma subunit)